MNARRRDVARLLAWYPPAWRQRYGDELGALLEDELADGRAGIRLRWSVVRGGLGERLRAGAVVGDSRPPADRVRAGALLVLVAWVAAVVAGSAFAKSAEHFAGAAAPGALAGARSAYGVVVAAAVAGAAVLGTGALVASSRLGTLARTGGWAPTRGHLRRATASTVVAVGLLAPLTRWAHHLDVAQRNGADPAYGAAFLAWAALVVVSLALWTGAAVSVARRLGFGVRALRVEASLALAGTVALAVLAAGVGAWWAAMATAAPWALVGAPTGTRPVPVSPALGSVAVVLAVALVTAAYGSWRILRSWRCLPAG